MNIDVVASLLHRAVREGEEFDRVTAVCYVYTTLGMAY
jgi:hypothetical protein